MSYPPLPLYGAVDRPIMRSRVVVRDPGLGWGWVGVGLLFVVGVSAVVHGARHEQEAAEQRRAQAGR